MSRTYTIANGKKHPKKNRRKVANRKSFWSYYGDGFNGTPLYLKKEHIARLCEQEQLDELTIIDEQGNCDKDQINYLLSLANEKH